MILAIESASTDVSIALADADGTVRRVDGWSAGQRQSHELLPRISALLRAEGRTITAVTALAVGTGPGSFTGLRVGMSVAKGLAVALERAIIGVPSLPAWLDVRARCRRRGRPRRALGTRTCCDEARKSPEIVDRDALAEVVGPFVAPAELMEAFALVDADRANARRSRRGAAGCRPAAGRPDRRRPGAVWSLPICAPRAAWRISPRAAS